jgi:hypothetical protein
MGGGAEKGRAAEGSLGRIGDLWMGDGVCMTRASDGALVAIERIRYSTYRRLSRGHCHAALSWACVLGSTEYRRLCMACNAAMQRCSDAALRRAAAHARPQTQAR